MSDRALYRFAVGVPLPEWRDLPPRKVSPLVDTVQKVGPRAWRVLSRTQDVSLREPRIEPYPRGSGFVRDEAELAYRVGQARSLDAQLRLSAHDWAHLEADQSRKIVLQRGGSPGWFVIPDGLINDEGPSMADAFRALSDWLGSIKPYDPGPPRYRRGTTHGWPDYLTTDLSYVMHACWAAASRNFDELRLLGMRLANILDEQLTPFSAAMFTRTGPLGKAIDVISVTEDGAFVTATMRGLCCRRRIVFGMPSAGNMWQAHLVSKIKTRLVQVPFFYHAGPAEVAAKVRAAHRPGWIWYSDDISGYDQSVCDTHQRELASLVVAPLMGDDGKEFAAFKIAWKDIPLLAPSIRKGPEASLYRKKGMTPSGDLMTAFDGTLINAARVLTCVARAAGISVRAARESWGSSWTAFIQGDDTVLGFRRGFLDIGKYSTASEELGYSTKLVPGVVFLMHLIEPETGKWAPLAARVYQQTVFNEYGGRHPAIELFSFMARATDEFWFHNPWATTVAGMIRDGECFTAYRVTPQTARSALSLASFREDLERELPKVPKRWERFGEFRPSGVSDFVATLLADDGSTPLPVMTSRDAEKWATKIASFMSIPADDRPPLTSVLDPEIVAYITQQEDYEDDV